jgi:hypothetical protein
MTEHLFIYGYLIIILSDKSSHRGGIWCKAMGSLTLCKWHNSYLLFIVIISVILLSIMLNVSIPKIILLSVAMSSVIMLSVFMLNCILLRIVMNFHINTQHKQAHTHVHTLAHTHTHTCRLSLFLSLSITHTHSTFCKYSTCQAIKIINFRRAHFSITFIIFSVLNSVNYFCKYFLF